MADINALLKNLQDRFGVWLEAYTLSLQELTIELPIHALLEIGLALKEEPAFQFAMLMDVSGVDYLDYGLSEWATHSASRSGFERGVTPLTSQASIWPKPRFAVVYHLLSIQHNCRLRLKVFIDEACLICPSVVGIWNSANWFEREVFDLFGILFENHPDLRRILTDYGFVGHPFRKDFPLIGNVEMRYDAKLRRVIYEPVSIEPRVLVPKVIRHDHRYEKGIPNG